jgi:hypothetical protein
MALSGQDVNKATTSRGIYVMQFSLQTNVCSVIHHFHAEDDCRRRENRISYVYILALSYHCLCENMFSLIISVHPSTYLLYAFFL